MLLGSVQLGSTSPISIRYNLISTCAKFIMSAYQKQNLEKLCKFIRNMNKSFVDKAKEGGDVRMNLKLK
jgi:hypothetical protein